MEPHDKQAARKDFGVITQILCHVRIFLHGDQYQLLTELALWEESISDVRHIGL